MLLTACTIKPIIIDKRQALYV